MAHLFAIVRLGVVRGLLALALIAGLSPAADAAHRHHAHHAAAPAPVSRYAAIVVEADSGRVLSATNPDRRSYPASLTKMMTLYLLFDALDQGRLRFDSQLPVSAHASVQAPSKLALEPGEHIGVHDAIEALVTKSANDVAVVIAEALGGTEPKFAQMMTAKAHALGMEGTVYRNASGLPIDGQVSTPRDQAVLARALIHTHAKYYHYFATREFEWRGATIPSHNRFMLNYEGADGLKTGYINASGFNLVASAVRNGHRLVGVVFGGNTAAWRDTRMMQLMDIAYAKLRGGNTEMASALEEAEAETDAAATPPPSPAKSAAKPAHVRKARVRDQGDDDSTPWGIQVGAFAGYKPAHKAATVAAKRLGGLLARASVDIDEAENAKHAVYRARLTGFTEEQARAACQKLARSKRECHIVQPSG